MSIGNGPLSNLLEDVVVIAVDSDLEEDELLGFVLDLAA